MTMRHFIVSIVFICHGAFAFAQTPSRCPASLEFADRQTALMTELAETHNRGTGLFLTRSLISIQTLAPNTTAQDLLDTGVNLRLGNETARARDTLDELIGYCPEFAEGYHQRALLRHVSGDLDGALDDLNTALSMSPTHLPAMATKAQVLGALGQEQAASAQREQVLEISPWMAEVFELFSVTDAIGTPI